MDSLILPNGVREMILDDARDFLRSEAWYAEAGIQHKRGYLLYGPPGTGKSSTIHALVSFKIYKCIETYTSYLRPESLNWRSTA